MIYLNTMGVYYPIILKKIDDTVFKELIDYFCTLEEYEKCGDLKR